MGEKRSLETSGASALLWFNRAVFRARRAQARRFGTRVPGGRGVPVAPTGVGRVHSNDVGDGAPPRRNVLLITTDQQRFDALGVNGQTVARTPHLDALAREGIDYRRAHVQNVVCMPSRSTILTGQHPRTHGAISNGISLPLDATSVAETLRQAGYRTALLGKSHFQPHVDLLLRHPESAVGWGGWQGPLYGFERIENAAHGPIVQNSYTNWLYEHNPDAVHGFAPVLTGSGGGDTGAPEVAHNPIPPEQYHTDWVADRTIDWVAEHRDEPWFAWMSFPDPHHPWDPPYDEVRRRIDWRDVPLPEGHIANRATAREVLADKPAHWLAYYDGAFTNPEGGPAITPAEVTDDQLREITAMIAVENELVDDAVGRVLGELKSLGLDDNTDIIFTSDHGDLGGDFGLLYKGPYHTDGLLRVPLIWRPAPVARVPSATVDEPVGLLDIAPTICAATGVEVPDAMEGEPLPTLPGAGRERVLTTWDSQFQQVGFHLQTIYRDGWLCTRYLPSTDDEGGRMRLYWALWARNCTVPRYAGTEGELYDCNDDPSQRANLWDDPERAAIRDDLIGDLIEHLPAHRQPRLTVAAPT